MKTCNYSSTQSNPNLSVQQPNWPEKTVINQLMKRLSASKGVLQLTLPSGYKQHFGLDNGFSAEIKFNSLRCLLRMLTGGINGWSEAYIHGDWDSPDLTSLVRWALQNEAQLESMASAGFITRIMHNIFHRRHHNSRAGSRRNIAAHYDLGNDFYKLWLDPSMTYSAALFKTDTESLQQAQFNKNQRILEMLNPSPGDHIIEIGCGWGGFAEHALQQKDVQIHGVTLSEEQLRWSRNRMQVAGLSKRADISLTDYRDLISQYDGVVSIEMFEAVGEQYWDTYFETLKRILKPGASVVLQVISIDDKRFQTYRKQADFIQRYIFPGGMLPSIEALQDKISEQGFVLQEKQLFGPDYARTLRAWQTKFEQSSEQLKALGYDESFQRLWRYYLSYCEGGFEEGSINVGLYKFSKSNEF